MIKKLVLLGVLVVVVMCSGWTTINKGWSAIRLESGRVVEYNAADGVVYVKGITGNVWSYYGDAKVGEKLILKIDSKNTSTYLDDEVINVFSRVQ